jgi:hypothetical protein
MIGRIKNNITGILKNLPKFQEYFCRFEAFRIVMSKFIPLNLVIILSGLILSFCSCTPQACIEETESFVKASFYSNSTNKPQVPDSLIIYGLNKDTTLYYKNFRIQPAKLPLNSATSGCVFIIMINGITDTLELHYTSYPHLISKECGYTFYHTLDTNKIFTKHAIDSIRFKKRLITTVNEENITIYY